MAKIVKKIHYFWFGNNPKNDLILQCIKSWREYLPNYEIIEWNENNYDISNNPFTKRAFAEKKWAFLSDYARLDTLNKHGGIYLDTDMEVLQSLDKFLDYDLFIGMESDTHVNGSIIGSVPDQWYIQDVLHEYGSLSDYETIPNIMTRVLSRHCSISNDRSNCNGVEIFPTAYFYPFAFGTQFSKKCLTPQTHTIHWWDHSWGSKKARVLKKIGLLKAARWLASKIK